MDQAKFVARLPNLITHSGKKIPLKKIKSVFWVTLEGVGFRPTISCPPPQPERKQTRN